METKQFPIEVVAGLTTGINLGSFGDIHECAEWVMGYPIWTHEFAEASLWERLRIAVFAQIPQLRTVACDRMKPDEVPPFVKQLHSAFGETVTLRKGTGNRTEHPLESMKRVAPGKPIIAVVSEPTKAK